MLPDWTGHPQLDAGRAMLHERVLVPIVADPAMVFVETIRHDGETMRHGRYGAKQIMEGTWIVSFHEAIQRLGAFLVLS